MLKPYGDRILVKPMPEEEKSAGGILLPDSAKERPQSGEVIAVGPGKIEDGKRIAMEITAGDTIVYSKYGGTEIKVDGEDYLILKESDVLAIK